MFEELYVYFFCKLTNKRKDKSTMHHLPTQDFFPCIFILALFLSASSVFSMDLIKHEENMNTPEDLKP